MNLIPLNFITQGEQTPLRRMMLEHALAGGGALSEYEITGNPVAFNTNVQKPLSGLTIPFLPVQSGTGDPSPENVRPISGWSGVTAWRTGVNLLDPAKKTTSSTHIYFYKENGIYLPAGKYTLSCESQIAGIFVHAMDNTQIASGFRATEFTFTLTDGQIVYFNFYDTDIDTTMDCQLEVGETASPFAEYTGASYPVTFPALGKNLLNPAKYSFDTTTTRGLTFSVQSDGSIKVTGTTESSDFGPGLTARFQLPAGTYYGYRDDGDVYVTYRKSTAETGGETSGLISPFTLDGTEWVYCNIYVRNPGTFDTTIHPQIARESTQTAYEPFTNTVYGGTLDAVTGVLSVEWAIYEPTGTESVYIEASNNRIAFVIPNEYRSQDTIDVYCTHFIAQTAGAYCYITTSMTVDELKAFFANNSVGIACKLATPYEIPLSDVPVPVTLIGDNTIWTDTNGGNTVKYLKKG